MQSKIFGPRIKLAVYRSNSASPPQAFCHDQTKIRKEAYGAIKHKPKKTIVLSHK